MTTTDEIKIGDVLQDPFGRLWTCYRTGETISLKSVNNSTFHMSSKTLQQRLSGSLALSAQWKKLEPLA